MVSIDNLISRVKYPAAAFPVSFSRIRTVWECPTRFYKQYVLKEKTNSKPPAQVELDKGGLIHKVLEKTIHKGGMCYWDVSRVNFNSLWNTIKPAYPVAFTHPEDIAELYPYTKEAFEQVYRFINKGNYTPIPEYKLKIDREGHLSQGYIDWADLFFFGYIDLYLYNKDRAFIIDWKKAGYEKDGDKNNIQLDLYAYFILNSFRNINKVKTLDYYVAEQKMVPRSGTISIDDGFDALESSVKDILEDYVDRINNLDESNICHINEDVCRWCKYRGDINGE